MTRCIVSIVTTKIHIALFVAAMYHCWVLFEQKTCHYKHIAPLLLICDNCEREHHLYCIDPPLETISDDSWYCPECQKKLYKKCVNKDRNFTFSLQSVSPQTREAIQALLPAILSAKSCDLSVLSSLTVPELLQIQSCIIPFFCECRLFHMYKPFVL